MQKLLIATGNIGKFREVSEVLKDLPIQLVSLRDLGLEQDTVEDGKTYAENAAKKARYFAKETGLMTLAEDSGVEVDVLKGELGIKTRRWGAGEKATDAEWIEFFLRRMERETNRNAKFICCASLANQNGTLIKSFVGETQGKITMRLQAKIRPGIPLSSVFLPNNSFKVYAAMDLEEKNKVSHRGKAFTQVREYLKTILD